MSSLVPDVIITGALLVDGDLSIRPIENGGIAVKDGRVAAVAESRDLRKRWPGVSERAFPTGSLVPGYIDSHAHLTMPGDGTAYEIAVRAPLMTRVAWAEANADRHLSAGVTTIRDLGSAEDFLSWARVDRPTLPRVIPYGPPLTRPRGHLYLSGGECLGPDEVADRVRRNLAAGARGIKVAACGGDTVGTSPHVPSFDVEELVAGADAAHAGGVKITAHATATEAAYRALRAGFDGIEHIGYLDASGARKLDLKLVDRMAEAQIAVGTTTAINLRYLDDVAIDADDIKRQAAERARLDYVLANCRVLHQRGVRLIAGTDAGWNRTSFGDFGLETGRLVSAGMSALEVVQAATALPAALLGLGDVGRLAPRRVADVVVVHGDPLQDAGALNAIEAVFLAGTQVKGVREEP